MNVDIVYEILKQLYLDGLALAAKKLIFCSKSSSVLNNIKFEKPVIFEIEGADVEISGLSFNSIIYWGDDTKTNINDKMVKHNYSINSIIYWGDDTKTNINDKIVKHNYSSNRIYKIRIFGNKIRFTMPKNIKDVIFIGEMTNLSGMFRSHNNIDMNIGKNWDTSQVTDMSEMFYACYELNKNIRKKMGYLSG